jgi:ADP-heptose:LPS heptosyltransferase
MTGRPAVLILRALGLGDFLTGVPAYRALRAGYPDHDIVLAAPQVLAPLAALTGAIDRVLPTGELQPVPWRGSLPAVAADLHGSGPASHRLVRALGAGTTMMYASAADPQVDGPWWDDAEHEVDRWCRLTEWWGVPADRGDLRLATPPTGSRAGEAGQPAGGPRPGEAGQPPGGPVPGAVVLHPGAASGSRRWPAGRFAAVAAALHAQHLPVLITGSAPERALAQQVAVSAGLPPDAVVAGRTGLAELAALIAGAALVISNDTGVAHLAVAFGVPSVTLFGPVSPALWGPPRGSGRHIALWRGTGDRPGDAHGQQADSRLLRIGVDDVMSAVAALRPADYVVRRTSRQPT